MLTIDGWQQVKRVCVPLFVTLRRVTTVSDYRRLKLPPTNQMRGLVVVIDLPTPEYSILHSDMEICLALIAAGGKQE